VRTPTPTETKTFDAPMPVSKVDRYRKAKRAVARAPGCSSRTKWPESGITTDVTVSKYGCLRETLTAAARLSDQRATERRYAALLPALANGSETLTANPMSAAAVSFRDSFLVQFLYIKSGSLYTGVVR
jgi:hypothetical protein